MGDENDECIAEVKLPLERSSDKSLLPRLALAPTRPCHRIRHNETGGMVRVAEP